MTIAKKLNEKLDKILNELEESQKPYPDMPDELWDMVKEFDRFETINEQVLNEVDKNQCGIELQPASIKLIKGYEQLKPYPNPNTLDNKIQWMIDYLDTIPTNDLIGLKITNAGKINYRLNNKFYSKQFLIHTGNCYANTYKLISTNGEGCGLVHMKYGENQHWQKSCEALLKIPSDLKNPIYVNQDTRPGKEYYYTFYSQSGYLYAFGVPKRKYDATILISCY